MRFEFATAGRIVFGTGSIGELPAAVRTHGTRALVVTGRDARRHRTVVDTIESNGVACETFASAGEPTVDDVRQGVARLREARAGVIVAIGGGSAIDAAKAMAALAANPGDPLDYLEVIGRGRPLQMPSLPFIAVPTTAGTGSEVTRNAVLGVPEHRTKVSLRSPLMLPRVAIVDPALTLDLPRAVTASSGLDAITQLIEPYVSARATPITDALAVDALGTAAGSIRRACTSPSDVEARTGMAYASLVGGLALANAGLGVVHGLAAPIGGLFGAPHGAICAALLAAGMDVNIAVLRAARADHPGLARYARIAATLSGNAHARPEDGASWVRALVRDLEVPGLAAYGVTRVAFDDITACAITANSMKANPVALTTEQIEEVLENSL